MTTPYSPRVNAQLRWRAGLLAGLAGGVAEVIMIVLYAGLSGGSAAAVARGITASVLPLAASAPAAIPIGLAIHFGLACLLGLGIALAIGRLAGTWAGTGSILLVLALVWAINFLVILPVVNPDFVHIVPMAVSFTSKLLFGLAAALVFTAINHRNPRPAESLSRYTSEEICHV